jgi:zinc transport system substrate-binding protein
MTTRLLALVLPLALAGCAANSSGDGWPAADGPKVVTSFAPIRCFALNVAGDHAAVRAVMSTQGPHHYQPGRTDAKMLAAADLFLINGLGLDDGIAGKMRQMAGGDRLRLVKLGDRLPEDTLLEGGCLHCQHEGEDGHKHDHGHAADPHVWLGPDHAEKMVDAIRDELKQLDPAHAADYDRRAAEYVAKLRRIKADGLAALKDKGERQFVSFHGSMGYFAHALGLKEPEVIQDVAGHEPSPKQLKALADRCVAKQVRVIAVEPQYSAATSAKVIVDELRNRGVPDPVVIVLDPLETAPDTEFGPDWYETKMRANIEALAKALK